MPYNGEIAPDRRVGQLLLIIIGAGASLRVLGLGAQDFWVDEAVTSGLMGMGFVEMLQTISQTESTPPLYYALAWPWAELVGSGQAGLRSLSALAGVATIPVAYWIGRTLSPRTALVTAALAAVSPALVWYAQEARAYALLVLFGALSLLFFLRTLEGQKRAGIWWGVASSLALLTHYFALFLVVPEAAWLLWRSRGERRVLIGCGLIAATAVAVLPLALEQRSQGDTGWIADQSLPSRLRAVPEVFGAGYSGNAMPGVVVGLSLLAAAAVVLAFRSDRSNRTLRAVAAVLVAGIGLPVALAVAGVDYVVPRNLLALWLPLALLVATGVAGHRSGRVGLAVGASIVVLSLAAVLAVQFDRDLQRDRINRVLIPGEEPPGRKLGVRVAFDRAQRGERARALATCPSNYAPIRGTASWAPLGDRGRPLPSAPAGNGIAADVPQEEPGAETLVVVVVCLSR